MMSKGMSSNARAAAEGVADGGGGDIVATIEASSRSTGSCWNEEMVEKYKNKLGDTRRMHWNLKIYVYLLGKFWSVLYRRIFRTSPKCRENIILIKKWQ